MNQFGLWFTTKKQIHPSFELFSLSRRKTDGKIIDVKTRHTLRQIGKDPFEVLPDGWIEVMHESGMPIFLSRKTRIVRYVKPVWCCIIMRYFLVGIDMMHRTFFRKQVPRGTTYSQWSLIQNGYSQEVSIMATSIQLF